MAIPSGSGTEVLKCVFRNANDNTEHTIINGVANHIYTIISIIICERAGNSELFNLFVADDGGTDDFYLLDSVSIAANQTYVFNDKFVISGTDELRWQMEATCDVDFWCSYIDQDWT